MSKSLTLEEHVRGCARLYMCLEGKERWDGVDEEDNHDASLGGGGCSKEPANHGFGVKSIRKLSLCSIRPTWANSVESDHEFMPVNYLVE